MFERLAFVGATARATPPSRAQTLPVNQAHLPYRPDIDGLRAIAVLPVIFYHSGLGFPGGYVGVDVFFVISGYLITKIIYDLALKQSFSFADFYNRRVRRLFPALFTMMLATSTWAVTHMLWTDVRDFGRSLTAATVYLSNVYFYLASDYFEAPARTMPLLHTWSLAVEEQFYIVVPFAIFALTRFFPRRTHVPLILGTSAVSFGLCVFLTNVSSSAAFYLLPTRAWELGLGAALAIWSPPVHRNRFLSEVLSATGIAAILFAALRFSDSVPFPGWRAAIPTAGTAMILSTGGRSGAIVERILATDPFTFVGKISYSLYLWHWPIIVAFTYAALHPLTGAQSAEAVLLSFAFATVSWRYVERPFRTRRLLPTARSLFAAAAVASLIAVSFGELLYMTDGYPARYPPQLLTLLDKVDTKTVAPDCFSVTPQQVQNNRLCVRGAPGVAATFVFVGDSHAGALSDGLFAAARSRGLSGVQFTAKGTVPLPGLHSFPNDIAEREPLTRAFLSYLPKHPELKTVIVTAFWVYRATGQSYRHAVVLNYDAQYDGSGTAYNPIAFRHALERLVSAFPDRHFVFIDDTPSGDALDVQRYARAVYNGLHPEAGLPRKVDDQERATYEPILKDLAARHQNVAYMPILGRICGPELCPLFRDGHALFHDGDHLTIFGSRQFEPALGAVFDNVWRSAPIFEAPSGSHLKRPAPGRS